MAIDEQKLIKEIKEDYTDFRSELYPNTAIRGYFIGMVEEQPKIKEWIPYTDEVRIAMDKQKARKSHRYIAFDGIERNGCPRCFEELGRNEILYAGQQHCSVCGQKVYGSH